MFSLFIIYLFFIVHVQLSHFPPYHGRSHLPPITLVFSSSFFPTQFEKPGTSLSWQVVKHLVSFAGICGLQNIAQRTPSTEASFYKLTEHGAWFSAL